MTVCNVKPYPLPRPERAINLQYGIWLIVSASSNFLIRRIPNDQTQSTTIPGCRVCVVTLKCGEMITGSNINIRSDLSTCSFLPAVTMDMKMPDQLASILGTLPSVNDLPYYNTKAEASIELIKSVMPQIKSIQNTPYNNATLSAIARPMTRHMIMMKPAFMREINNASTITTTLTIGLCSFIVSLILHIALMFIMHRCKKLHRFRPFEFVDPYSKQKIRLNPVFTAPADMVDIETHPHNPWKNKCKVVPIEHFQTPKRTPKYPTSPPYVSNYDNEYVMCT